MQEFLPQEIMPGVCAWPPSIPLSESDEEAMMSNPQSMYLYSLRTHKRLPGRLHDAMLLFSFHPEFRDEVRHYLDWVVACEERNARMESYRKSEAFRDRMILGSMVLVVVAYVFVALVVLF